MVAAIAVITGNGDIRATIDACHIAVTGADPYDDLGVPKRYRLRVTPDTATNEDEVSSGLSHEFTPASDGTHQWDGYIFPVADDYVIDLVELAQAGSGADTITASSEDDPTEITTAAPHGLTSGETVVIAGHTGATPDINGTHVATVTGEDTFTIDVEVTVAGTGGTVATAGVVATEAVTVE